METAQISGVTVTTRDIYVCLCVCDLSEALGWFGANKMVKYANYVTLYNQLNDAWWEIKQA